jgi:amidase
MNSLDLAFTSALEQARLIRNMEISPVELTQLYLDRIETLDQSLGSYFTVMADQALEDAKAKTNVLVQDRSASGDDNLPPFFGVPIAIKDLCPVAGVPCSYGVKVLRNQVAVEDAGIVTRIKQAGFILLGKTASSALGSTPYTEPKGFPPTRNPWNLEYTPGGSSGGSAAAVAAGLCAIAHGSDGGGSIRGPASCCGLVGIKPARGRVSHAPVGDKLSGLAIDGPLARTVADAAALLDVLAGYIPGDPYWLPDPNPSFLDATQQPSGSLRIAYATAIAPIGTLDSYCEQAVLETVHLLESMGHHIEPISLNFADLIEPLITVWQASVDMGVPWFCLDKLNRWLLRQARSRSGGMYLRAVMQMQTIARRIILSLNRFDVLVLPTFMHPTIRVGEWAKLRPAKAFENIVKWVAPCPPFNATGQPVVNIPIAFDPQGVPLGVQLVGRPAAETTIISLAARIEEARPWSGHRPAIAEEH